MFDERLVGRLPAGDHEQRHEGLDLTVRHLLAVDGRRAQRAQQVGAGVGPPFGDDRQHVGLELVLGLQSVGRDRGVTAQVAEEGHDRVVPLLEAGVVGLVEAEHVDDHVDRELDRELPDEVDAALVAPRVDEVPSVAVDDRHELLGELAAAERRLDQVAVHRVLAALHLQDRAPVHRLELPGVVVRCERLVLERPLHVVVARDHPRLHRLVEEDRMLLAHRLHERVGVSCELRRQDVRRRLAHHSPLGLGPPAGPTVVIPTARSKPVVWLTEPVLPSSALCLETPGPASIFLTRARVPNVWP